MKFIEDYIKSGIEPVIFLDSCVCLHIIKVDFSKIIALKEYIEKHPEIKINAFFVLLELCSRDGVIDKEKLQDFKLRMNFFKQITLKVFIKFKYDINRDLYVFRNIADNLGSLLEAVDQILGNSYCTLLKIRSLALRGLSKRTAKDNLDTLTEWMVNDLDIFRGPEYKLAMNIFGGNTEFRKMIGLDNEGTAAKKSLWVLPGICFTPSLQLIVFVYQICCKGMYFLFF